MTPRLRLLPRSMAPEFAILNRSQHDVAPIIPTVVLMANRYWSSPRAFLAIAEDPQCEGPGCRRRFVQRASGTRKRRFCCNRCKNARHNADRAARLAGRDGGGSQTP